RDQLVTGVQTCALPISAIHHMRYRSKGVVDFFQYVENWRSVVFDKHRDVLELSDVDVASLDRCAGQSHPKHRLICLESDGSDQHGAQPKDSRVGEGI